MSQKKKQDIQSKLYAIGDLFDEEEYELAIDQADESLFYYRIFTTCNVSFFSVIT